MRRVTDAYHYPFNSNLKDLINIINIGKIIVYGKHTLKFGKRDDGENDIYFNIIFE